MVEYRNQKGQALPFMTLAVMILLLCWLMIINVGKLESERMMMQNAADNAALSVAAYKARALNKLMMINWMIGTLLYGTEYGVSNYWKYGALLTVSGAHAGAPIPVFPKAMPKILGMGGDSKQEVISTIDLAAGGKKTAISGIYNLLKGNIAAMKSIFQPYPVRALKLANDIAKRQAYNSKGETCGADNAVIIQGLSWGLKQNDLGGSNCIKLYYPKKWTCCKFCVACKIALEAAKLAIKAALQAAGIPGEVKDVYQEKFYKKLKPAWLYIDDKDKFAKHCKIIVIARKSGSKLRDEGYPIGKGLFKGIVDWPDIQTVAAAAAYNTRGPGFPDGKKHNIKSVIEAYKDARRENGKGGWKAHLVPVKKMGVQH